MAAPTVGNVKKSTPKTASTTGEPIELACRVPPFSIKKTRPTRVRPTQAPQSDHASRRRLIRGASSFPRGQMGTTILGHRAGIVTIPSKVVTP